MRIKPITTTIFFLLVPFCFSLGCGGNRVEGEYDVYSVSGEVTYNGKALEGAYVGFYPDDETKPVAYDTTDSSGRFDLTTYNPGDGAVAGTHSVVIKKVAQDTAAPMDDDEAMDPEIWEKKSKPAQSLIPRKYASKETSGLTARVKTDGNNHFKFDLK